MAIFHCYVSLPEGINIYKLSIVYCIYMWFHKQPDLHIELVPINWAHFEGQPH